jgi:hypothetical protein
MSVEQSDLQKDIEELSRYFSIWLDDWDEFVIVRGVRLPPGFNRDAIDILIELPADYPQTPPGLGDNLVYASAGLRYQNRIPAHYYESHTPSYSTDDFGPWAWVCYQAIHWDPMYDTLIGFVEMLRADFTNPQVR